MYYNEEIYLGLAEGEHVNLQLNMANRHGLIAGASGTGKTITMKVLAESFSDAGVPVFLCDVKGDVSGLCVPGEQSENMEKRIDKFGLRDCFSYRSYPVCFWDVYGENGHPVRATISDMGADLLSRILELSPAQEGVLNIVFRIADDNGLILTDIKDLRAMLSYVGEHREEYLTIYGNIASQSLGGILRALLPLEDQGGDLFFGEPMLDIYDWIRTDTDGRGIINLLDCVKLVQNPQLYATFLLWLMAELFERLPEAGDLEKPKLVFFFDEAHMLFYDAPKVLIQKIEQMVKLIRSKGVGIYFVTQSPNDIPDTVLDQLSNRVQHALRAYTPAEQKVVKAAAQSMRPNPSFDAEDVITELGVGHALVSLLDAEGVPGIVQNTAIICPQSLMAQADADSRADCMAVDGMNKYDAAVDNLSAYETLAEQQAADAARAELEAQRIQLEKERAAFEEQKAKEEEAARKKAEREAEAERKKKEREIEAAYRKMEREEEAKRRKIEQQLERDARERQKAVERRKQQIEKQIINTGVQILKRGLFNTLKSGRK